MMVHAAEGKEDRGAEGGGGCRVEAWRKGSGEPGRRINAARLVLQGTEK